MPRTTATTTRAMALPKATCGPPCPAEGPLNVRGKVAHRFSLPTGGHQRSTLGFGHWLGTVPERR